MAKRYMNFKLGDYKITVRDYQYKGRPPVSVHVSGTRLGEHQNPFGEPCYFFESADAMSINEGIAIAKAIVRQAQKIAA